MDVERKLFGCPQQNRLEIEKYYPDPTPGQVLMMSISQDKAEDICVHAVVKRNLRNEKYIEVIFYNEAIFGEELYQKYVILQGYRMAEPEEERFLNLLRDPNLVMDRGEFADFQESVRAYLCDLRLRTYSQSELSLYLDKIYRVSHRSGPREILYKAGFDRPAYDLDEIEGYNIIGSSPQKILGVPLKLIRILCGAGLEKRLYTEEMREFSCKVYRRFSDYFGKNGLPNKYQWHYLEGCSGLSDKIRNFDKTVFSRLSECTSSSSYTEVMRFIYLSSKLGKYNPYRKMPKLAKLAEALCEMHTVSYYVENMDELNAMLKEYNNFEHHEYGDDEFIIITPITVSEFMDEAETQGNCIMNYINDVADGETSIVFMRKRKCPEKSHVTIEIKHNGIEQAKAAQNELPSKRDFEFIEKFAYECGLYYNPAGIILGDDDPPKEGDELWVYLTEFEKRRG